MKNVFEKELKELLSEDVSQAEIRSSTTFDPWEEKIRKNGIILFGSGLFGRRILKGLREIGIEPLGFADNNQKLWNSNVEGLKIFSPEEAVNQFPDSVYMVTIWSDAIGHPTDEVEQKLHSYKAVEVISFFFLFWKYPQIFIPYFSIDSPVKTLKEADEILKCFYLFEDEASQKEYVAQIRWRLLGDYKGLTPPSKYTQYFHDDLFTLNEKDVFVDCGAFDGDTIKNFLSKQKDVFTRYYALEPDPVNCEKLKVFVDELPSTTKQKVTIKQCAVSDTAKQLKFSSNGSLQSAFSENGNIVVDCISIDEEIKDAVTYIKMDTEGAEPDIIKGAKNTISANTPIMAVSVYHEYNHLWRLPLDIKRLSDNYQFFLRPHCKASWDLICYAIPKQRLLTS